MSAKIDREALRAKLPQGAVAVINEANRLGYCLGEFENGLIVLASADASDWVALPSYTMREARAFGNAIGLLPTVDMGR